MALLAVEMCIQRTMDVDDKLIPQTDLTNLTVSYWGREKK